MGGGRLVIVDSESEAEAMLTLNDLDGQSIPVFSDTQLNTETVLIPNEICLVHVILLPTHPTSSLITKTYLQPPA